MFLKTVTLISWLMVLIQLLFQIVLLVMHPYGKILEPACEYINCYSFKIICSDYFNDL
jgi:hypothetical protein